jgi:hypothetical protein
MERPNTWGPEVLAVENPVVYCVLHCPVAFYTHTGTAAYTLVYAYSKYLALSYTHTGIYAQLSLAVRS